MDSLLSYTGTITGIYTEPMTLTEPFLDIAERFAHLPGTVLLASGGDLDCAKHHMLAVNPWLSFSGRGNAYAIKVQNNVVNTGPDPFKTLRELLNTFKITNPEIGPSRADIPVAAGLFGYLSYDLKDFLEDLPRTSVDDLQLPQICLFAPSIIVIHYLETAETLLSVIERKTGEGSSTRNGDLSFFHQFLAEKPDPKKFYSGSSAGFSSNFTKPRYLEAVDRIKEYIASGHIYQANLSQRFHMNFSGDSFHLFKTLFNNNPAPFFAYINVGDHHIISTSPERFLYRQGREVETRPIKGTRPRGRTPSEDAALGQELRQSKKDDAELSMIVDLLRNDFGKVCEAGSVRVARHKMLESYKNVFHLVSIVEGALRENHDSVDLIRACFPGGSITGCPKIRSMEIIDELEPTRRHIYTGSIGYISFHDTMDLSIAIRTATVHQNKIIFSVGGGIVYDSDPEDEYEETLHKGQTLMKAFKGKGEPQDKERYIWINGVLEPAERAKLPVSDLGFQYGYGFFETIRVCRGHALLLDAHMKRFNHSWTELFNAENPDITWSEVIQQVISKNQLSKEAAAVKIIAAAGDTETFPCNASLIVTAKPYIHRLVKKKKTGLDIAVYPEPRQTPLAAHKTLNYLYYFLAGRWAERQGSDEALILNPDHTISETNTANILLIRDNTVLKPVSPFVLPGIMENAVCDFLRQRGYSIVAQQLHIQDFFDNALIILTNSLMGAVPVLSIDGKNTADSRNICETINEKIL